MFLQYNKCKRNDYLYLQWIASKCCFYSISNFLSMAKCTKNIQIRKSLQYRQFLSQDSIVSTVNLPLSKHTKCKDLAVAYKNQTTRTPFLEKWWELVKISQSIIGNNQIAATDRSSIIIRKIYQ